MWTARAPGGWRSTFRSRLVLLGKFHVVVRHLISRRCGELRMAEVKVDPVVFWERIMKLHKTWNVRQSSERPFSPA